VLLHTEWRSGRPDKTKPQLSGRRSSNMESLFPDSFDFLEQLRLLDSANQDEVVATFLALAKPDVNLEKESGHKEVLSAILERVAFFPMKPAVMEAELSRLGLSSTASAGLASAWASIAKTVVTARRKVQSNLVGVAAEVRRQLPEGTESLLLSLQMDGEAHFTPSLSSKEKDNDKTSSDRRVNIRLDPQQAFALYEQLEAAQAGIDAICK